MTLYNTPNHGGWQYVGSSIQRQTGGVTKRRYM
jgi:hypothetical protein